MLAETNGGVCPPAALVDYARNPAAPIHALFEWNNDVAAEAHRREQARLVVRELRVVVDSDHGSDLVQAFVHVVRVEDDQLREGYRLTSLVIQNADEHSQMLDEALRGLRGWRKRYERLAELKSVFSALDSVMARRG
jgi:hypothetical protein